MKKLIVAAKNAKREYFSELNDIAINAGYELTVSDNMDIKLKATTNKKVMPEITVKKIEEDGTIYYDATFRFPTLRQSDMEYFDDIESYIKSWKEVGKLASEIAKTSLDIETEE